MAQHGPESVVEETRQWYYVDNGERVGPISDEVLVELVRLGRLTRESLVWTRGYSGWIAYGHVQPEAPAAVACSCCGKAVSQDDVLRLLGATVCPECKPGYVQRLREGVLPVTGLLYAGFWLRFGAKVIDWILLGLANTVVLGLFLAAMASNPENFFLFFLFQMVLMLAGYAIGAAYTTYFLGRFGATPGKMLCSLKVVDPEGESIGYLRAFGRYFAEVLSGIVLYVGYLMAVFDDQKRTLHDHICSTRVVRV